MNFIGNEGENNEQQVLVYLFLFINSLTEIFYYENIVK